ncbi:hypothetical protein L1049_006453 [Liquidambar formosana]|uniref:RING-type domain-containing protein n=1 Tax=Liquidambar formosana TaxID=63359 RepID=A0AAP0RFJ0_LIQFO
MCHNLIFPKFIRGSIMLSYAILAATHLKWAWNFLFRHPLLQKYELENGPQIGVIRYERTLGFEEAVECAVCLCKIEEGEEMRELRCDHLFHRDCLDRWLGHRHATCPLCRAFLAPRRRVGRGRRRRGGGDTI